MPLAQPVIGCLFSNGGCQCLRPSQNWLPNLTLAGNQDTILFLALRLDALIVLARDEKFLFLSSANEVSTGPTCQFLCVCVFVCLFVCLSGLFFKASNWIIYWLLTVVLAPYLSD